MFIEVKKIRKRNEAILYDIYLRPSVGVNLGQIVDALDFMQASTGVKLKYEVRKLENSPLTIIEVKGVTIQFILALGTCFGNVKCKLSECESSKYYDFTRVSLGKVMFLY